MEIHSSLIYVLHALSTHHHLAILSLLNKRQDMDWELEDEPELLIDALAEVGNNWERQPLSR